MGTTRCTLVAAAVVLTAAGLAGCNSSRNSAARTGALPPTTAAPAAAQPTTTAPAATTTPPPSSTPPGPPIPGNALGIPPIASTTTSTAPPGTKVLYAAPVDTAGHFLGAERISATQAGSCESGSDSVGNVEVYRCMSGNGIYDPCWADAAGGVLCMESPWTTTVIRLTLSGVPPTVDVAATNFNYPWGVELTSGANCLAAQGAHDSFDGRTIDYYCTGGSVSGLALLLNVNRSAPYWTYQTVVTSGSKQVAGPTVSVASAWFAGPAPVSAPACAGSGLSVSASVPSGGMSWLVFGNKSSYTCSLYGYPGVAALNSSGVQVQQIARTPATPMSPTEILLPPGGSASAILTGEPDYPSGSCPTYPDILVTPPNTTTSTKVPVDITICSNGQIAPVGVGGFPLTWS